MKSKIYFMLIMTKLIFPAVLLCLLVVGCSWLDPEDTTIKYEVTGTASSVYITMHNENSSMEELDNVSLPWSKEFIAIPIRDYNPEAFSNCAHLSYLSAKNNGDSGRVTENNTPAKAGGFNFSD